MAITNIMFSINDYDSDGDISDQGIFLHAGPVRVKVGTVDDLQEVINQFQKILDEIKAEWSWKL